MNENDKTEILEPVETPAENITEPSKDGSRRPKWLPPLVAAVCAVILVAAGIVGWNAYSGAKLAEAKEACVTAADTVRNNANEYNALLNGDAADAAAVRPNRSRTRRPSNPWARSSRPWHPNTRAAWPKTRKDWMPPP